MECIAHTWCWKTAKPEPGRLLPSRIHIPFGLYLLSKADPAFVWFFLNAFLTARTNSVLYRDLNRTSSLCLCHPWSSAPTKVTVTTKWGLCGGQLINTSATVAWFWGMSLHDFLLSFRRTTKEVITYTGTTGSYHHTHLSAQRALYPLILLPRMCACACVIAGVYRDTRMKVWRQLQVLVISCHFIGDRVSLFSCYYKFQTSWPTSFLGFYVLLTGAMKLHLTSHKLWESGFRSLSLCNKHFTHWNIFLASLMPLSSFTLGWGRETWNRYEAWM